MTSSEEAEIRGEIFGLKILLFNFISELAGRGDEPLKYLDALQKQAVQGIVQAKNEAVKPAHMRKFQEAAAGIVVQAVEGAKAVLIPTPPPSRLQ